MKILQFLPVDSNVVENGVEIIGEPFLDAVTWGRNLELDGEMRISGTLDIAVTLLRIGSELLRDGRFCVDVFGRWMFSDVDRSLNAQLFDDGHRQSIRGGRWCLVENGRGRDA